MGATERALLRSSAMGLAAGIALGLFARGGDLIPRPAGWIANLGVPWLVVAAAVGAASPTRRSGAAAGAIALIAAAATHYLSVRVAIGVHGLALLRHPVLAWALVGALLGSFFGWLGRSAVEDERRLAPALALTGSFFAAEAIYLIATNETAAMGAAVPAELALAVALPLASAFTREGRWAIWATAMIPTVVVGVEGLRYLDRWLRLY